MFTVGFNHLIACSPKGFNHIGTYNDDLHTNPKAHGKAQLSQGFFSFEAYSKA